MLEPQKLRKLQEYAGILADQGQGAESEGRNDDAVKAYIKLVDVLLLLARESEEHTTWNQYTKQAESYQIRVKSLMPADQQVGQAYPPKSEPKPVQRPPLASESAANPNKMGSLRKILKPFQKPEEEIPEPVRIPTAVQKPVQSQQVKQVEQDAVIATCQKKLEAIGLENKSLKEKIDAVLNEKENLSSYYENQIRELNEKIASSVPRNDYEALQVQLSEMISFAEYERLKTEISNRVPKKEYDDILNRLINSVPREMYLASELKASHLEESLKESVPAKILDNLAAEVSLLTMLASIPVNGSDDKEPKEN
ncbi:MAG: hypothetical protein ACYC7D_14455 [Nitrososphaerales archaeon]